MRRRGGVAAALVFAVLLVRYGSTVTVHAERGAREAAKTERVKDFLAGRFTQANPAVNEGDQPLTVDLVEQGARRVAVELQHEPAIQAELMTVLGQVYMTLGHYERAAEPLSPALGIRRWSRSAPHEDVARTARLLGEALHHGGRYAEAEHVLRSALAIRDAPAAGDPAAEAGDSRVERTRATCAGRESREASRPWSTTS